jgi:hypothetical protein
LQERQNFAVDLVQCHFGPLGEIRFFLLRLYGPLAHGKLPYRHAGRNKIALRGCMISVRTAVQHSRNGFTAC